MRIGVSDVERFAVGCGLLGAGGGGDWRIGRMLAERLIVEHGPVEVIDVAALPDDALIMPVAMIGAPTVAAEQLLTGKEGRQLKELTERMAGRPVDALMAAEIGGMNGVLPVAWAASLGLPVIDADGMGRAFPRLGMSSMSLAGVRAAPVVIADACGNVATFESPDIEALERLARSAVSALGGSAAMTLHVMTAEQARDAVVAKTVTLALQIGTKLQDSDGDRIATLLDQLGGHELLRGKIVDVDRRVTGGFARGSATIEAFGNGERLMRIEFQNENLVAVESGEVVAAVPDIIAVVDLHHGIAIATEALRYGQRVAVLSSPCAPLWRTAAALKVVGPEAFGYSVAYSPVMS